MHERTLQDARFGHKRSLKYQKKSLENGEFKKIESHRERDMNCKGVDWREEFMKSMTFELSTVYS